MFYRSMKNNNSLNSNGNIKKTYYQYREALDVLKIMAWFFLKNKQKTYFKGEIKFRTLEQKVGNLGSLERFTVPNPNTSSL